MSVSNMLTEKQIGQALIKICTEACLTKTFLVQELLTKYFLLQELLTKHKILSADFLEANYERVFQPYQHLLNSENYVTRRQALKVSLLMKHHLKLLYLINIHKLN